MIIIVLPNIKYYALVTENTFYRILLVLVLFTFLHRKVKIGLCLHIHLCWWRLKYSMTSSMWPLQRIHCIIVMGNFNVKLGFGESNEKEQLLQDLLQQNNVYTINAFFKKTPARKWMWTSRLQSVHLPCTDIRDQNIDLQQSRQ